MRRVNASSPAESECVVKDSQMEHKMQNTTTDDTKMEPTKNSIRVMFVSLLIDLFAFTMILPLLPSLLDYYEKHDQGGLYPYILGKVNCLKELVGAPDHVSTVLFGGLIGSLFSFLQFLASPVIGALSDVYGRKPLLLLSLVGSAFSYGLWAVSSNFTIFVLSRIVGGISKGNVSISTAIVADVSSAQTRGKGMAMIGIAFSVGFILGPITGAMFALWAKSQAGAFFVIPALLALVLTLINVLYVVFSFPETLPQDKRAHNIGSGLSNALNYINPISIFGFHAVERTSEADLQSMQRIGFVYFLYLFLYSGLEFTLTFLTHIRFQYTSVQQGKMFFFIGIIMAAVQGGFVRRIPPGNEKKMALVGLALIIPSFIIIGLSTTQVAMYVGLALYSFASATVVPCMTTIISSYGSVDQKGTVMGIFRSLGALARAFGPIVACTAFWSLGAGASYMLGGLFLIIPVLLMRRIGIAQGA